MAHSHSHSHSTGDENAKRLLLAFGVTATFMIIEVTGGLISGSLALLADAGHMLTDAAALLFALLAVQFARRPPNARHTFGWLRLTTLAAFVNAIALVVITILIVWEAFQRFRHPQPVAGTTIDGDCYCRVGRQYSGILDIAPRQQRKKSERTGRGASRAGRSAGFRRCHRRRADHYGYGLDPHRPDSFRAGIVPCITQCLAAVERERE